MSPVGPWTGNGPALGLDASVQGSQQEVTYISGSSSDLRVTAALRRGSRQRARRLTTRLSRMSARFHGTAGVGAAVILTLALSFPPPLWAERPSRSFTDMLASVALVPPGAHDSDMLSKVTLAVGFIKRMALPQAQQALNEALQLDPRNAHLHFLNGFVYHLQARQGDIQKADLALEGYQQALRIDPGHWIAQEFLGLAHIDLKQFAAAKRAFSEVLLLTPQSARSIYGLMVSAYLTGDAKTACAMADQFLKVTARPEPGFLRSSIPVYASCGQFARADWIRAALIEHEGDGPEIERIDQRLRQWRAVYTPAAQGAAEGRGAHREPGASHRPSSLLTQADAGPDPSFSRDDDDASADEEGIDDPPTTMGAETLAPSSESIEAGPQMLLVDVVLLSTQELISTSKGVNLLSALTLQLGSFADNVPAFGRVTTSTESTGSDRSSSTSITRAVTVPALSYSLNIANANSSLNEVLARPTLAAIEGMPSEFFSGTNLSAGVVSASEQGGTTVIPVEKSFGIRLSITPTFVSQGRVQLKVEAQRTALNAAAENRNVAYQIEIGETTANANVVMNLGQTLVLSGLSEKSSSRTRDGVPLLQDLPGVQYFFSNKRSSDLQRSVLILVTPRAPVQISESASDRDPMAVRMQRLRETFGFAEPTPPNIEAVMTQIQGNDFFREFRQGDVSMERWDRMRTTGDRLKEALGFLYY